MMTTVKRDSPSSLKAVLSLGFTLDILLSNPDKFSQSSNLGATSRLLQVCRMEIPSHADESYFRDLFGRSFVNMVSQNGHTDHCW